MFPGSPALIWKQPDRLRLTPVQHRRCLTKKYCFSYLEALELLWGVFVLSEARVEDEELGVSQPRLQLLNTSLQLLQERVGQRGEGRARVFHGDALTADKQRAHVGWPVLLGRTGSWMLWEDFLKDERGEEEKKERATELVRELLVLSIFHHAK